jgi:SurA N-terminal domain
VRTRSVRRAPLVALAAIAALTLGGCGTVPPGAAAVVDGTTIPRDDVTQLAEAQCAGIRQAAQEGQQSQASPRKQLVQQALGLLMDIELSLKYGESEDVSPRSPQVAATYDQIDPLIQALPEKHRDFMEDTFHRWAEGRDVLTQVGQRATGEEANAENAEALLNAGYQERESWLKTVEVDTDPRFGPTDVGWPGGSDPSVSKAVSKFAKDAAKEQPDPAWVSALPSSQKCG